MFEFLLLANRLMSGSVSHLLEAYINESPSCEMADIIILLLSLSLSDAKRKVDQST